MNTHFAPSRRTVLKSGGALVVSFSIAGPIVEAVAQGAAPAAAAKPVTLTEVDSFLAIDAKGMVTVYSGKIDFGTGVRTALMQIVADELDVPFSAVKVVEGDTALTPDQGKTWASVSIQIGGMQLRNAAATARQALVAEAAKRLNVDPKEVKVSDGVASGGGKSVSYGDLIGDKKFSLTLDHTKPAASKDPKDFKFVGKSIPRVDIPEKCTGRYAYMQNLRVPGMLHGRVVRPPSVGAKLEKVDENAVKDIPGVVQVVRDGNFLGVVASNEWAAIKGAMKLKQAASWSKWEGLPEQGKLFEHVRATKVVKSDATSNVGNTAEAMGKDGVKKITATYDFAINTHGSIGPSCAVAEFNGDKLTSWSSSQATHDLRKQLAQMFGMPPENVHCMYLEGAGCYGRNGHEDAAADAAILAKAAGKPVRVQWSRADEHGWDPKGPPTLIDLRATLDGSGNVTAWESDFFIPQAGPGLDVPLIAAELAGKPTAPISFPGNIFQDSAIPYKFANVKTVCHRLETTPFRPSWIRTPGRMQNTYGNECFMDELAAAAGVDPFDFRIKYIDPADKRGLELLDRLMKLAKWEKRASPQKQDGDVVKGRGMSYVKYELVRTYVGCVADVEVKRSTGEIKVNTMYLAHDCGQIINPDGLRNQLDGNVLQTLSRTLKEELKFDRSHVTSLDWNSYPILTFPEMPALVYDLIDRPNEKPWGAGEPASAVIPGAISGAVFDATGVRLRSAPYTPEKVKAALSRA
jgi:CO/xanthine dehydrogenase Mo-binding subunit